MSLLQHSRTKAICLLLALPSIALQARAEEPTAVEKHTTVGQEVMIGHHAHWSANCTALSIPTVKVLQQPEHGHVDLREGPVLVGKTLMGSTNCDGKTLNSRLVYYVPDSGYAGSDGFSYELRIWSGAFPVRYNVAIKVE